MNKLQKGFSTVEVVLVLVFLLAVGGAGYYVCQNQNDDSTNTEQTTQVEKTPIESTEDIDEELSEIDAIDLDSELDTSELDAELNALE